MATSSQIDLPYLFEPRSYQWSVWDAWDAGIRRFGEVWHRRAGKDKTLLNFCVERMLDRVGNYYHIFPKQNQGRRVIWTGIDRNGLRYPVQPYGIQSDAGAGLAVSYAEKDKR